MNRRLNNRKNAFIISLSQIFCVVIWYGVLMLKIINPSTLWPILVDFHLLVFFISFLLPLLFPIELNWTKNILLSIPAAITYQVLYWILPWFLGDWGMEFIPTFCLILIPITLVTLLLNAFAIWLGSKLHAKLSKQKD
jgi:hypothetical protein